MRRDGRAHGPARCRPRAARARGRRRPGGDVGGAPGPDVGGGRAPRRGGGAARRLRRRRGRAVENLPGGRRRGQRGTRAGGRGPRRGAGRLFERRVHAAAVRGAGRRPCLGAPARRGRGPMSTRWPATGGPPGPRRLQRQLRGGVVPARRRVAGGPSRRGRVHPAVLGRRPTQHGVEPRLRARAATSGVRRASALP